MEEFIARLPEEGGELLFPENLKPQQKTELEQELSKNFGTPSRPMVSGQDSPESSLNQVSLVRGSKLYRQFCLHCHGLSGNGRGPTALWVQPHPRDYRQGIFKYTSSAQSAGVRKPRREDLLRTLRHGLPGTAMPPFDLLEDQDQQDLVSYVIHLSLRGQVEFEAMSALLGADAEEFSTAETVQASLARNLQHWQEAERTPISVPELPAYLNKRFEDLNERERRDFQESIVRGSRQFLTGSAQCVKCHTDFGRASEPRYDFWGTVVRPRDLTAGKYRGGSRPRDFFCRIHSGITGSEMPAFDSLPVSELLDLVSFLRALPYPKMLPENLRQQVYGAKKGTASVVSSQ
jgi:mono/diheme cytochrome c family protein